MQSSFPPKPIKTKRTKWGTTLGKRKSWEERAKAKIKPSKPQTEGIRVKRTLPSTPIVSNQPNTQVGWKQQEDHKVEEPKQKLIVKPNDERTQWLARNHKPQVKPQLLYIQKKRKANLST